MTQAAKGSGGCIVSVRTRELKIDVRDEIQNADSWKLLCFLMSFLNAV